jgi:large subunit ribosomal protein L22
MKSKTNNKEIFARASFVSVSPRKLRLITNAVKNLSIEMALASLKLLPKAAGSIILKVLQQGVANAKNNFKLSPSELKIKSLTVGEGSRSKRSDRHAHGSRFGGGVRHLRTAHVILQLSAKNGTKS